MLYSFKFALLSRELDLGIPEFCGLYVKEIWQIGHDKLSNYFTKLKQNWDSSMEWVITSYVCYELIGFQNWFSINQKKPYTGIYTTANLF